MYTASDTDPALSIGWLDDTVNYIVAKYSTIHMGPNLQKLDLMTHFLEI